MYRNPTPQHSLRDLHEAERLDLFGVPIPPPKQRTSQKRPPARHMHRVASWEDAGGWDDDELDDLGPDEAPTPRPDPQLGPCLLPEAAPIAEVDVSERDAASMTIAKADRLVREAKVSAFAVRHAYQSPLHVPGDHNRPVDYTAFAHALARAIVDHRIKDECPVPGVPALEITRSAGRTRYRLRFWQSDPSDPHGKRGRWTTPKDGRRWSFATEEEARDVRFRIAQQLTERATRGKRTIDRSIPAFLAELLPGNTQSNAVQAASGEDPFFAA